MHVLTVRVTGLFLDFNKSINKYCNTKLIRESKDDVLIYEAF